MNRELLRVSMNERQVKQACEDWARSRSRADGAAAHVEFLADDGMRPMPLNQTIGAEVIFSTKRKRAEPKVAGP